MFTKIYEKIKEFMKENYKGLLALLIIFLVFHIELPYQIYTPGGAVNLNKRIEVENGYSTSGSFNMAYVSAMKASLPFVLISKVIPDWDLVKKENITYENETMDEMLKREKYYLEESIDAATINAFLKAGKKIDITKQRAVIVNLTQEGDHELKLWDEIVSLEEKEVKTLSDITKIVEAHEVGDTLSIEVLRDQKLVSSKAKVYDIDGKKKIGIRIVSLYDYISEVPVEITSKNSEAGSSGGLMMSLTIYNQLVEKDITKGKKIVGTGTIDIEGNVGEIGGVKYKLMGAVKSKADLFMCPLENYEEALQVKNEKGYDILIIAVKTFDEALKKLEEL